MKLPYAKVELGPVLNRFGLKLLIVCPQKMDLNTFLLSERLLVLTQASVNQSFWLEYNLFPSAYFSGNSHPPDDYPFKCKFIYSLLLTEIKVRP